MHWAKLCKASAGTICGFTGLGSEQDKATLLAMLQAVLPIAPRTPPLTHDMDIACRAAFSLGRVTLVYTGTGSIAAFIDSQELTHLAGVGFFAG